MLVDVETRRLFAEEHVAQLRLAAAAPRRQRTRRWLADRLVAAGERLRPEPAAPQHRPLRAG
jgi:hypothetical protein